MTSSFPFLSSPLTNGKLQLKNRMVMSPMTTSYANADQTPSQRLTDHFVERAKGGVGLITVELVTVDTEHRYLPNSMTLGDDQYIEGHRRLVDAIHQHDCKVQPQISHTGPESIAPMSGGQTLGPSINIAPVWGWPSRELTVDELAEIAIQYGEAARRVREAGYDGMELHAAHCYNLLGSFISPLRNKRSDEYSAHGKERKTRFLLEVLEQVKARAGGDLPITLSISGYERYPGGRTLEDTQLIAPMLVAAGVDCFRVSGGVSDNLVTGMVNSSEYGYAVNVAQAEAIKNVVDVPVMVVGRIHDPEVAEDIIANGQADLIAMARPLLADPYFPKKVLAGTPERIRRCISCENCIDSQAHQANLACAVNPLSGREGELSFARSGKKVVVVGGGTGGLEAARLAAEAGHRVVLMEKQRSLGGSLTLASTVHSDNERFLRWLLAEVKRLPIDVRTATEASVGSIRAENPDAVIVATGAVVETPDIPGVEQQHVLTGALLRQVAAGVLKDDQAFRLPRWQQTLVNSLVQPLQPLMTPGLLRRVSRWWMPVGREVVIVGADLVALELAEFLAERGRRVHVLESGRKIAPEVGNKRRKEHMDRFDKLKITLNSSVDIVRIEKSAVVIEVNGATAINGAAALNDDIAINDAERRIHGDSIIVAGNVVANTVLADELENAGMVTYAIGDCTGLGLIAKAVRTAAEAVSQL